MSRYPVSLLKFIFTLAPICIFSTSETPHNSLLYTTMENEISIESLEIEGTVPDWIKGVLVRNGPAKFEVGEERVAHWFDGLAMLQGFHFENGRVSYNNKFVRSGQYETMMEHNSLNFAGFSNSKTRFQSDPTMEHSHNTVVNVAEYGHDYVALTEVPLPLKFDLETLETLGEFQFEDELPKDDIYESAHPVIDRTTGETFNFLIEFDYPSLYKIYSMQKGSNTRDLIASIPTYNPSYMHSFSVTENYIILAEYPLTISLLSLIASPKAGFSSHFSWNGNKPTQFTVIDRHTGDITARCEGSPLFSWHHVNAFETSEGIILDLITANPPPKKFKETNSLIRFHLDFDKETAAEETLYVGSIEMPWIKDDLRGKHYQFVYGIDDASPFPGSTNPIIKINVESQSHLLWEELNCIPSEAIFIPNPNSTSEDDGVLLSLVLDDAKAKSFLLILNAKDMTELGRGWLPHHIPRNLHGAFFKAD